MGGAVFPPCYLTWGQTMVEVMKIMATSFKRLHASTATLSVPNPAAGHRRPTPQPETLEYSQTSLDLVRSLLLCPGTLYAQSSVCALPESVSPVLCKFWQLYSVLMATSSKRAYAIPRSAATRAPAPAALHCWFRRHPNTVLSQSLWALWVMVHTRYVWAPWASLAGMGFDSKRGFAPPTVLLGLPLCPWTWDISSKSLQQDIRGWYTMYLTGLKLSPAFLRQTLPPSACGILDNHF